MQMLQCIYKNVIQVAKWAVRLVDTLFGLEPCNELLQSKLFGQNRV